MIYILCCWFPVDFLSLPLLSLFSFLLVSELRPNIRFPFACSFFPPTFIPASPIFSNLNTPTPDERTGQTILVCPLPIPSFPISLRSLFDHSSIIIVRLIESNHATSHATAQSHKSTTRRFNRSFNNNRFFLWLITSSCWSFLPRPDRPSLSTNNSN